MKITGTTKKMTGKTKFNAKMKFKWTERQEYKIKVKKTLEKGRNKTLMMNIKIQEMTTSKN